jgi:hypothetical protein
MDEEEEGTRTMEAIYKGLPAHFASIELYESLLDSPEIIHFTPF